ncbi:hypothetical protein NDU88_001106 [Pleurodeles waltl]|uniref:Uncharacterized protein n=1 Tax=Pleurodeles waltl TaxID=8319 RepID=A0AAV7Q3B1_PLEWA|nr:hypothetical protein NDU88_001106 [Pleurodeles waltl]
MPLVLQLCECTEGKGGFLQAEPGKEGRRNGERRNTFRRKTETRADRKAVALSKGCEVLEIQPGRRKQVGQQAVKNSPRVLRQTIRIPNY